MKKNLLDQCEIILGSTGSDGFKIDITREMDGVYFVLGGYLHFNQFFDIQKKFSKVIKDSSCFDLTGVYVPIKSCINYSDMDNLVFYALNRDLVDLDSIVDSLSEASFKRLKKVILNR